MIAFHRVKKSPLIIGIVDRIKIILIVSRYFHSANKSCPILSANCRYNLRQVRLFLCDSSRMDKSSSATSLLYSDAVKREKKSGRQRRRSRDEKGNQGVGDFRFTNILQLFSIYFFFSITLLYHFSSLFFFIHDIYPHPQTRPTPTTHDI